VGFRQKLKELSQKEITFKRDREKLPFKRKLVLSALMGFAFAFTFFLFGMLDIFFNNREEMLAQMQFSEVLMITFAAFFAVWVGILALLLILPGISFTILSSIVMGVLTRDTCREIS